MTEESGLSESVEDIFLHACERDLDEVEASLRKDGNNHLADALFKLQQDIGMDRALPSTINFDGEITTPLREQYEGDLEQRLPYILQQCRDKLTDPNVKSWMTDFIQKLQVASQSAAPAQAPPPTRLQKFGM